MPKNVPTSIFNFRTNFQIIHIFYQDMSNTEYNQVQDASISDLLSEKLNCISSNLSQLYSGNIGGNMGMFLGMSLITITEICLYFSKIIWLGISKKRREYMYSKRVHEKVFLKIRPENYRNQIISDS